MKRCFPPTREASEASLTVRMDRLLDISGTRRNIRCSRCKASRAWQTYREHHKALCSTRTSSCSDCSRRGFYSTARRTWFSDHSVPECIGTIPVRMPGRLTRCIPACLRMAKLINSNRVANNSRCSTHPHEAHELFIAYRFVRFIH